MTNVLTLPAAPLDQTTYTPQVTPWTAAPRSDFQTELSIAATRFEFAATVGAMIGGLVGLGVGTAGGGIIAAAPASAVGAAIGGAALGIPAGIYSLIQLNDAIGPRSWWS